MDDAIAWSERFSVGHPDIDGQHRRLVEMANHARTLFGTRDRAAIETALAEVAEYTRTHFHDEEMLLQQVGYPELKAHIIQHKMIIAYVEEMLANRAAVTPEEVFEFVAEWVLQHIAVTDHDYAPYLKG
ncbi:MAG: bacteriohemerythrin [Actinomycetota bacterium]